MIQMGFSVLAIYAFNRMTMQLCTHHAQEEFTHEDHKEGKIYRNKEEATWNEHPHNIAQIPQPTYVVKVDPKYPTLLFKLLLMHRNGG